MLYTQRWIVTMKSVDVISMANLIEKTHATKPFQHNSQKEKQNCWTEEQINNEEGGGQRSSF